MNKVDVCDNGYILITPVKNEKKYILDVIKSVINQTKKPNLWVIVDDGSTDGTSEIIDEYAKKTYIKKIRLPEHVRDVYIHYAKVCNIGFNFALKYCDKNNISFKYVGLLDGDTVLQKRYFEKLLNEFKKDEKLGIASGGMYNEVNNALVWEDTDLDIPRGTGRLWRKRCFLKTGGYSLDPAMDTISNVRSILSGYNIKQFKNIKAIHKRKSASFYGYWKGYTDSGELAYYLDKNIILVILSSLKYATIKPYYLGIPYFIGFCTSLLGNKTKVADQNVRSYFYGRRLTDLIKKYLRVF